MKILIALLAVLTFSAVYAAEYSAVYQTPFASASTLKRTFLLT